MRQVFAPAAFLPQNLRNSAAVLLFFQDLCGNLCTVAAGIHGGLFNHAVGFRFAHALVLDQIALGTVHQPDLGNLIPDEQKIGVQEAADSCPVAAIQVTA